MTKTYYIIKASNTTLDHTYLVLQMKEHYGSVAEAMRVIFSADTDIIPPESPIYRVDETVRMEGGKLFSTIAMSPLTPEKE